MNEAEGQVRESSGSNGCWELAEVCHRIVAVAPDTSPQDFLRALGQLVAGIDPGIEGIVDLARGGSNVVAGGGFKPEFDDGTAGQARHFAGMAASVAMFGARATELVAHAFVDSPDTADGRLSAAAVRFAKLIMDGDLPVDQAHLWIVDALCLEGDSLRVGR